MSYIIQYGKKTKQELLIQRKRQSNMVGWIVIGSLLFLGLILPQGQQWLRGLFFPWVNTVTMTAFEGMLRQIESGESISVALVEFCREVISGAYTPI